MTPQATAVYLLLSYHWTLTACLYSPPWHRPIRIPLREVTIGKRTAGSTMGRIILKNAQ